MGPPAANSEQSTSVHPYVVDGRQHSLSEYLRLRAIIERSRPPRLSSDARALLPTRSAHAPLILASPRPVSNLPHVHNKAPGYWVPYAGHHSRNLGEAREGRRSYGIREVLARTSAQDAVSIRSLTPSLFSPRAPTCLTAPACLDSQAASACCP